MNRVTICAKRAGHISQYHIAVIFLTPVRGELQAPAPLSKAPRAAELSERGPFGLVPGHWA